MKINQIKFHGNHLVVDTLKRADPRPYRTGGYDEELTGFSPLYNGVLKKCQWNGVPVEKLTDFAQHKKFLAFLENRKSIFCPQNFVIIRTLSQKINQPPLCLFEMHFNSIFPSTPVCPK